MEKLVLRAKELKASDLHLIYGLKPCVRVNGSLVTIEELPILDDETLSDLTRECGINDLDFKEVDLALTIADTRCRLNIFKQQDHISMALRLLNDRIPDLYNLGLPTVVTDLVNLRKGIVLVTGETGSGKSTTLAALLDAINHQRQAHIITLEDPIEYIYTPDKCIINQREVGKDTNSFADGLKASLREDPDIILLGELRDATTIETALTAAETGHLVFATIHANGSGDTIDRIISVIEANKKEQIRMQLSTTLKCVVSQQLIKKSDGSGRVLAYEIMKTTPAIANLIREGNTPALQNALATSIKEGNISMDMCLAELASKRKITTDEAVLASNDKNAIKKMLMIR